MALAVGIGFALLYGLTAATTIQGFDCGELVVVEHSWGVAHPPGFPTFILLAGLFERLLPLAPALSAALWSALCGSLTCGLMVLSMRRAGCSRLAAGVCAVAWGLLPSVWMLHTLQEVFATLHCFVAALIFSCLSPDRQNTAQRLVLSRDSAGGVASNSSRNAIPTYVRSALAIGLLCGLGAGVHTTLVFAAPLIVYWFWCRRTYLRWTLPSAALGLAAGGLCFLYLVWAWHGTGFRWGSYEGPSSVLDHVLRRHYGALSLGVKEGPPTLALRTYGKWLLIDGVGLLLFIIVGGLLALRRRSPQALCLLASHVLAGIVFLALFRIPDTEWSEAIISRFFGQATLYGLPLAGLALDALGARLKLRPSLTYAASSAAILLIAAQAFPSAPSTQRNTLRENASGILASVQPRAILLAAGDSTLGALWYAQEIDHERRDVSLVATGLLPAPWYGRRLQNEIGYVHPEGLAGTRRLIEFAHAQRRPIYTVEDPRGQLGQTFQFLPVGAVLQILPKNAPMPPPSAVESTLVAFQTQHPIPAVPWWQSGRPDERLAVDYSYVRPWRMLLSIYQRQGDRNAAERARQRLQLLAALNGAAHP